LTDLEDKLAAACLVYDGKGEVVARYDKMHLFDAALPNSTESYSESCVYSPGSELVVIDSPVGKLGIAVCYDMRFPEFFRQQMQQGMQVLAIPAAFTQTTGAAHWHTLLRARAIENLCYVAAAAQTGEHVSGRETYGHSLVYGAWGELLAEQAQAQGIVVAAVDLARQQQLREQFPALTHRRI
jgi:predicted amidohydrolase